MSSQYEHIVNTPKKNKLKYDRKKSFNGNKNKSEAHKGEKNFYYGKSLSAATLSAAAKVNSKPIWVYSSQKKLIRKIENQREAAKILNISRNSIRKYRNTGIAFKGYLLYNHKVK